MVIMLLVLFVDGGDYVDVGVVGDHVMLLLNMLLFSDVIDSSDHVEVVFAYVVVGGDYVDVVFFRCC